MVWIQACSLWLKCLNHWLIPAPRRFAMLSLNPACKPRLHHCTREMLFPLYSDKLSHCWLPALPLGIGHLHYKPESCQQLAVMTVMTVVAVVAVRAVRAVRAVGAVVAVMVQVAVMACRVLAADALGQFLQISVSMGYPSD